MMQKLSLALALVTIAHLTSGQVQAPGECPKMTYLDSFDLSSIAGTWYEMARYTNKDDQMQKCLNVTYTLQGENPLTWEVQGVNLTDEKSTSRSGTGEVLAPGRLRVQPAANNIPNGPNFNFMYLSKNLAVAMAAEQAEGHCNEYVWILCRERTVSASDMELAKSVVDRNGFSSSKLSYSDQNGC